MTESCTRPLDWRLQQGGHYSHLVAGLGHTVHPHHSGIPLRYWVVVHLVSNPHHHYHHQRTDLGCSLLVDSAAAAAAGNPGIAAAGLGVGCSLTGLLQLAGCMMAELQEVGRTLCWVC